MPTDVPPSPSAYLAPSPNLYYPPPPLPLSISMNLHKVWILDCKSCHTFLTNRGMKAVLLLRPNVSLYSSDALPTNCSPYISNPNALRPRAPCIPSSSSNVPPRTCECLTQTLCCHGCGSAVGYMIVIPCIRCTSSITATNRATNGHRFVFHSSEIVSTERHYIHDEPGVIPYDPVTVTLDTEPMTSPFLYSHVSLDRPDSRASYRSTQEYTSHSRSSSPAPISDYLPTPPLELADPALASLNHISSPRGYSYPVSQVTVPYPHPHLHSRSRSPPMYHLTSRPDSVASSQSSRSSPPPIPASFSFNVPEQKEQHLPRKLRPGDILFWHHLARSGEIPGVEDDERARGNMPSATAVEGKLLISPCFNR